MNWRFVGYVMAGYGLVWYAVALFALSLALVQPVNVAVFASVGTLFAPIGAGIGWAVYLDRETS